MAISESIKRAVLDLETALAEADTIARAVSEAHGEHGARPVNSTEVPTGLVELVRIVVDRISGAADGLIREVNRAARG